MAKVSLPGERKIERRLEPHNHPFYLSSHVPVGLFSVRETKTSFTILDLSSYLASCGTNSYS